MKCTADNQLWLIPLSRYERDNLAQLLSVVGNANPIPPFEAFNTGDWVMMILGKLARVDGGHLPDGDDRPNTSLEQIRQRVADYRDAAPTTEQERQVVVWAKELAEAVDKFDPHDPNSAAVPLWKLRHLRDAVKNLDSYQEAKQ